MDPRFEESIPNFVKQIQYIFMWYFYVYINDKVDKYTDGVLIWNPLILQCLYHTVS